MADRIRIILIDDNVEDSAIIATTAQRHTMIVTPFTDGKSAFKELRDQPPHYYQALIFDARCIWDTSVETKENDLFLGRAITELERVEKEYHTHYPMVVYTGFSAEFLPLKELVEDRNGKIFTKSSTEPQNLDNLFKFLRQRVENLEEWVYRDVFEIFELGYFNNNLRQNLKEIIKNMGKEVAIHDNFTAIRKILEEMYRKIRAKDVSLLPTELGMNLESIWVYLTGKPTIVDRRTNRTIQAPRPLLLPHESAFMKAIEETTSANSHTYLGTSYAYKSVVFALLEQLLWFKKLMQTP